MLATVRSAALIGVEAIPITVEVSVQRGLPCFLVVGLPDAAVRESRDRVQAAFRQGGLEFPAARVTVNLAPADLRKEGTGFDLAIALALLVASRQAPARHLDGHIVVGELSLDGSVRPVRGVLAVALEAARRGGQALVVPRANAGEAQAAGVPSIVAVGNLEAALAFARSGAVPELPPLDGPVSSDRRATAIFDTIRGQEAAKRALEIAAAGGHGALFVGPPGTGKTMLARALPELLPDLDRDAALEATCIHSVAGLLGERRRLLTRPPFRAPHVSASVAGMLGGGSPFRPGELSLAHRGVLFLDELPEFNRAVLEALRQPLETGTVTLVRARGSYELPARVQLVAAMNPCPCGFLGHPRRACKCAPSAVARYRGRVSGPLLERIDLFVEVPVESKRSRLLWSEPPGDGVAAREVRERVREARRFAARRHHTETDTPAQDPPVPKTQTLPASIPLEGPAERLLLDAAKRWSLSARAVHRTLRVARTIADLNGEIAITVEGVAEALGYRHEGSNRDREH